MDVRGHTLPYTRLVQVALLDLRHLVPRRTAHIRVIFCTSCFVLNRTAVLDGSGWF